MLINTMNMFFGTTELDSRCWNMQEFKISYVKL